MVYNLLDKTSRDNTHTGTEISENKPIDNELHKPITREYKKHYLHLSYEITFGFANQEINIKRELDSCYMLLIFTANILGIFLRYFRWFGL